MNQRYQCLSLGKKGAMKATDIIIWSHYSQYGGANRKFNHPPANHSLIMRKVEVMSANCSRDVSMSATMSICLRQLNTIWQEEEANINYRGRDHSECASIIKNKAISLWRSSYYRQGGPGETTFCNLSRYCKWSKFIHMMMIFSL